MISVSFVSKYTPKNQDFFSMASTHPAFSAEQMEYFCQSSSKIVETVLPNSRAYTPCLAIKMESNKQRREELGGLLYQKVNTANCRSLVINIQGQEPEGLDILIGFLLAGWCFNKYYSRKPLPLMEEVIVVCNRPAQLEKKFRSIKAILEGVYFARNLTSEPPNVLYPCAYANRLKKLESIGVKVEILDQRQIEKIGMTAILSVSKGSAKPPAVVVMQWKGRKSRNPIVIAGKGVCFDSGGVCLKPPLDQLDMKWDKAGAGVVAGVMKALALTKSDVSVVGVVGLVENMPDGNASKSGDVIRSMSGQTIEIVDTDSEGRLVLADCLWYASQKFKPKLMIDLGTLTLETVASLGRMYGGLYSNSPDLAKELIAAGQTTGELVWELPMGAYFAKQLESSIADIKNAGLTLSGENGAAAEFLKKFVGTIPWAHLDIAGVSWTREDLPHCPKGATGFGVRLIMEWISSIS